MDHGLDAVSTVSYDWLPGIT